MPDYVLAADIGGTKIRVARVGKSGQIRYLSEAATPRRGGTAVVDTVTAMLRQISQENVRAVGVGVPGLAYKNGDVWAPNIPGWKRMPLGNELQKRLHLPVVVESDRNAFVLGEAWKGAARNCRDVVFVALGTGVGAGVLVNGRLLRGHGELAGCIGWMAVRDQLLPQYSKVGCLESHIGGQSIGVAASRQLKRNLTARDVSQLASQGNKRARQVLHEAGTYLGMALANLVSILNPEIVVIGGGVAEAGRPLLNPAIQTMKRWAQPIAVKETRVVCSRLKGAASLLGVAKLAFDSIETGETSVKESMRPMFT